MSTRPEGDADSQRDPASRRPDWIDGWIDERRVTLEHLRAFVEVNNSGGFQQAARVLHLSQPAVTKRIRQMENYMGCTLLERRKGEYVGLTPAGRRFLQVARDVLRQLGHAVYTAQHPELCDQIRIGVPDDFIADTLPARIRQQAADMPGTRLGVLSALSSPLLRAFHARALDVAIVRVLESGAGLVLAARQEDWGAEPLCWVADRPLDFDAGQQLPLVLAPDGCVYRHAALACLAQYARPFAITYSSGSHLNLRRAIDSGLGVGVLRRAELRPGDVVLSAEHGFPPLPDVHLAMGLREDSEPCRRVATMLHAAWRETRMQVQRPVAAAGAGD